MPRESSKSQRSIGKAKSPVLVFRPLTPRLMEALGTVLRGNWGAGCWCMYPRLTDAQMRALPGSGSASQRRRDAMTTLARRRCVPGLLAFEAMSPSAGSPSRPEANWHALTRHGRRLASTMRQSGSSPA